jgi:hypothetical protein
MFALRWRWVCIALVVFGASRYLATSEVTAPSGRIAPDDPVQTEPSNAQNYAVGDYSLEPLAKFDITARVLSKENYRIGREADLSPLDLALGWGAMSDSSVLDNLSISQGGRFYQYRWELEPPIAPEQIATHSANMHLIPANSGIAEKMQEIRVGHVVHLVGHLVEVRASDGWKWRSSLTREDTGAGACELIWVESISVR